MIREVRQQDGHSSRDVAHIPGFVAFWALDIRFTARHTSLALRPGKKLPKLVRAHTPKIGVFTCQQFS